MKPFEIALFKHFIYGKGMTTVFINQYRKNHWDKNPVSIEEYLAKADVSDVCVKGFYFIRNSNYGVDYWNNMQLLWMEFLAANENNYGSDEWYKLQGVSKILRYNWDAAKHWKMENRLTTAKRMGISLELLGIKEGDIVGDVVETKLSEELLREISRKEVMARDFTKEREESKVEAAKIANESKPKVDEPTPTTSILGEFEFVDLRPRKNESRRLKDDEISINRRSDKGRITFNQFLSKEFKERGGYEYASLLRNKKGETILFLNDTDKKGVPVSDGATSRSNSNVTIGSKTLTEKLCTYLNIERDYEIVRVTEIEKTSDYVAYLVETI